MEVFMTSVDPQEVQKVLGRLDDLEQQAGTSKDAADLSAVEIQSLKNEALKEVDLDNGKVDAAKWTALTPEVQHNRYEHLVRVASAISVLLDNDGPSDKKSIMFRGYLSNFWVVLLTLLGLIGTIVTLSFIHQNFHAATTTMPAPPEDVVLFMVILMGVLGGFLHLTSSLAMYVGNRHLMRSWVIYYLLMPVEGAALAVALYLLVRVGVLSPSAANSGTPGTANLNLVGIYGFSVLAGIFSKQALEMLGDVFNVIFAKVKGKDAAPAAPPPTPPQPPAAQQQAAGGSK
jgi:hypothetical protein